MTTITFKNWIQKFQNDKTPTGDLAKDILNDPNFPNQNNKTIILEYLYKNNAIPQAIETFQNTWQAYLLTR